MVVLRYAAAAAALAWGGGAQAHVSLTPPSAPAGAYQVLRFGVGHGCDGKATTGLRIEIPAGVTVARPQPKPGWSLRIERGQDQGGVGAISWSGELPAQEFDEFLMLVKLPANAGPLAFPATQACGAETVRWTDAAAPGGPRPEHPAPSLVLTPAASSPEGGHEHRHQDTP
jgi:uncharacterized protein YcnI